MLAGRIACWSMSVDAKEGEGASIRALWEYVRSHGGSPQLTH